MPQTKTPARDIKTRRGDADAKPALRVALVHDWLVGQRGGEQVLVQLAEMFPQAPIYTLVHRPGAVDARLEAHPIVTSFVQSLPFAPARFRQYLPLFPKAIASFDLTAFDLIVSTSHCVAHGIRVHRDQHHVSYVHTPMRYLYDQMPAYLPARGRRLSMPAARFLTAPLRAWDVATAQEPDCIVANSAFVQGRIAQVWDRQAEVVYPPVDVAYYAGAKAALRRGLLYVGALVPYKRADCVIALAEAAGMPLTIVGTGPERARLEAMAGPDVQFVGSLDRAGLRQAYAAAQALVFAGEEDFGIVPVEAMAAGCPVLALGRGGLVETVTGPRGRGQTHALQAHLPTGVLFDEPTLDAMLPALQMLLTMASRGAFGRAHLGARAERFGETAFREGMTRVIETTLGQSLQAFRAA